MVPGVLSAGTRAQSCRPSTQALRSLAILWQRLPKLHHAARRGPRILPTHLTVARAVGAWGASPQRSTGSAWSTRASAPTRATVLTATPTRSALTRSHDAPTLGRGRAATERTRGDAGRAERSSSRGPRRAVPGRCTHVPRHAGRSGGAPSRPARAVPTRLTRGCLCAVPGIF